MSAFAVYCDIIGALGTHIGSRIQVAKPVPALENMRKQVKMISRLHNLEVPSPRLMRDSGNHVLYKIIK